MEERRVEVFDPRLAVPWSRRRQMPSIVFGAAAAAPGDGKIYLFGGFVTPGSTLAYDPDPDADTWAAAPPMPTPRHGLAAVVVDGKVYVLGGSNGTAPLRALEVFDPANRSWQQLAPMPTARVFLAAAAFDHKIYAIGGSPDCCGNGATGVVEIYDTLRQTWSTGPSLPQAMQTSAAAAFAGRIYVLGGFVPGQGAKGSTFELDPTKPNAVWIAMRSMPAPRDQAPAVALADGIHVLGGSTSCHCSPRGDHPHFVPAVADLGVVKTDEPGDACPGETVTYTITVTNHGPAAVHGARVTDVFPPALAGATWTCAAKPPPAPPGARCHTPGPVSGGSIDALVDLPAGGKVVFTVTGKVALDAAGTLVNTARVRAPDDVEDRNAANDTSSGDGVVIRHDRLAIRKTELPARGEVAALDLVLYEIVVTNHCGISLRTTVEDDLAAAGLTDPRWCRGTGCSPSIPGESTAGNLRHTAPLPAGGSVTYMASGTVPCVCATPTSPIRNVATAKAPGQDLKSDVDVNTVEPAEDRLEVTVSGPGVLAGCSGDYAIAVTNPGPCPAPQVLLSVAAPPGLDLVSLSPPPGFPPCAGSACALGDIPAGAPPRVVTARFAAAAGLQCPAAPLSIGATVQGLCTRPPDPPAEAVFATGIPCDLAIAKTDGLAVAAPGDCIGYTIDVANHGCGAVTRAVVTDTFPGALESVRWCRGAECVPATAGNIADTLDLPRGGSATYSVLATISPQFAGPLRNSASVALPGGAADAHDEDNSATDLTVVEPLAGVTALCAVIQGKVAEGGSVTFTFVLWNGGPAAQADNPGDEFVDVLPAGLTLVSAVATSGTITILPADTVRWNGAIAVGGMVTIEVTATADLGTAGMTFCNPATVFFDADGDGTNESSAPSDEGCHSCCVLVTEVAPIPTLSHLSLALLALLLAALGLARCRGPA